MISLVDFVNKYKDIFDNDITLIMAWSRYNHNESQLIDAISRVAALLVEDKYSEERRTSEWSIYLLQELPPLTKESSFTECINRCRLIYLAYKNKSSNLIKELNKVINMCDNIDWLDIKTLHYEIYEAYMEAID